MMKIIFFISFVSLLFGCKATIEPEESAIVPGSVRHINSFQSMFVTARKIDIWVPGNFNPKQKYAVIYMQDGQMLFDSTKTWNKQEWQVDETMDQLVKENKIEDAIVVGIWNNNEYRSAEYFPQEVFKNYPKDIKSDLETNYFKGKLRADDYLRFLVYELKPFIDGDYPTYRDARHTFIMGSSKGGVISLYAICEYPQIFGGAGCISTDWVLTVPQSKAEEAKFNIPVTFRNYLNHNLPDPKDHMIYFDYGTASLDSLYRPQQILVDSLMVKHGYTSKNWITKEFPGDDHSEHSWARRLHIPLQFLLGKNRNRVS